MPSVMGVELHINFLTCTHSVFYLSWCDTPIWLIFYTHVADCCNRKHVEKSIPTVIQFSSVIASKWFLHITLFAEIDVDKYAYLLYNTWRGTCFGWIKGARLYCCFNFLLSVKSCFVSVFFLCAGIIFLHDNE